MSKCQFCGKRNPPNAEACAECGATLPPRDRDEPAPPSAAEAEPGSFEQQVLEQMRGGKKIAAIKIYRAETGVGLKEAKDAVEALARQHDIVAPRAGCAGVVLLLLGAVAAFVFVVY